MHGLGKGRGEGGVREALGEMQGAWAKVVAKEWRGTGGFLGCLGSRISKWQRGEREDLIKHRLLLSPPFLGFAWLVG